MLCTRPLCPLRSRSRSGSARPVHRINSPCNILDAAVVGNILVQKTSFTPMVVPASDPDVAVIASVSASSVCRSDQYAALAAGKQRAYEMESRLK